MVDDLLQFLYDVCFILLLYNDFLFGGNIYGSIQLLISSPHVLAHTFKDFDGHAYAEGELLEFWAVRLGEHGGHLVAILHVLVDAEAGCQVTFFCAGQRGSEQDCFPAGSFVSREKRMNETEK